MIDVVAMGELLIDFTCVNKGADGYPTMEAHPGGISAVPEYDAVQEVLRLYEQGGSV